MNRSQVGLIAALLGMLAANARAKDPVEGSIPALAIAPQPIEVRSGLPEISTAAFESYVAMPPLNFELAPSSLVSLERMDTTLLLAILAPDEPPTSTLVAPFDAEPSRIAFLGETPPIDLASLGSVPFSGR
jgi:hypothetical protein